jgi:hypothetical protein
LLLKNFKFDLRAYVVVMDLDPIQAFLCDEGLARFCTELYEEPSLTNFDSKAMHLTNYSINKETANYVTT